MEALLAVELLEFGDDLILQRQQIVPDLFDVAHACRGLNTLPVSSSRISDGPLAGPHSPGTTKSTRRPKLRRRMKVFLATGLPAMFALVETIGMSTASQIAA